MSKNEILLIILNFFLLICESTEDNNNIFNNINVYNSSIILKKSIIKRKVNKKYIRLLEEEDTTGSEDIGESQDEEESKHNVMYIPFTLLQTKIKESFLKLYLLTNSNYRENITFNLSISVYTSDRIRNLEASNKYIIAKKEGSFNSNNRDDEYKIHILSGDLSELGSDNIQKIVLNDIDIVADDVMENEGYDYDINLIKSTDSSDSSIETKVDMSNLEEETPTSIYLQESMSSCSNELKFNLTVNHDIDLSEISINLEFTPANTNTNNRRPPSLSIQCVLSSENKRIIPCQLDEEPPQFPATLSTFMEYIDSKLIIIKPMEPDKTYVLECYEDPPIAAIISIVVLFFFVVIVVIIIIIVMNKKGRGERGYDMPNESNSNNILGLGGASK